MGVIGVCQSNLVFWLDLHTGAFVRTNDFKVITLPIGMSPYQYFGLASPPLSKRAMPIADDYRPQVKEIIQIEGIGAPDTEGLAHAQQIGGRWTSTWDVAIYIYAMFRHSECNMD